MQVTTYKTEANCTDISLYYQMNNANSKNYLDPSLSHNIICTTDAIFPASLDYSLSYIWHFYNASGSDLLISNQSLGLKTIGS